jgi:hypothetical protein
MANEQQSIFQKPPEVSDLETQKPSDKLHILLVGKEEGGKSRCAVTAPKPVLLYDFDLKAAALAGIPQVFALSFKDPAPHIQPYAFNQLLDVLTKLEGGADLRDLGFARVDKGVKPATHVDDSISTIANAARRYALYSNSDIRRRISFGGTWTVDFVKNFDGWNAEMSAVDSLVTRQLALPFHFVAVLHEAEEEAEDSTVENKKFTGRIGPFPARYQLLFKYFTNLWHIEQAQPIGSASQVYKSRAQILPNYRCPWVGNTLVQDDSKQFVKPDISALISEYKLTAQAVGK